MQVELRSYNKQDFKSLQDIVRVTWHYDKFCTPETADKLAAVFLSSCLTNHTFSRVAIVNGSVAGIILVNNIKNHHCPLSLRFKQIKSLLSLYLSKEGRSVMKIFENVSGIDKALLKESRKSYPAELALFVIDPNCRGNGVGKRLFQSALAYMESQQLSQFYLFTDTSCNYGFYEHQGMTRRCEKDHMIDMNNQKERMKFFIYDYTLPCTG